MELKEIIELMKDNAEIERVDLGRKYFMNIYRLSNFVYFECYDSDGKMFRNIDITEDTPKVEKRIDRSIKMIRFFTKYFGGFFK